MATSLDVASANYPSKFRIGSPEGNENSEYTKSIRVEQTPCRDNCSRAEGDSSIARTKSGPSLVSALEWLAGEAKPTSVRWRSESGRTRNHWGTTSAGGYLGSIKPKCATEGSCRLLCGGILIYRAMGTDLTCRCPRSSARRDDRI